MTPLTHRGSGKKKSRKKEGKKERKTSIITETKQENTSTRFFLAGLFAISGYSGKASGRFFGGF